MTRSVLKRALAALRRSWRRGRKPRPGESEWLRLILLMRRLQHGQMAIVRKLDAVDSLASIARSARAEFAELDGDLAAACESAEQLERGLAERAKELAALPDPAEERAGIDRRVARLDELAARLETLASERAEDPGPSSELLELLDRFDSLAARLDSAHEVEHAPVAAGELERLHARIDEVVASLGAHARDPATPEAFAVLIEGFGVQLDRFEGQVQAFTTAPPAELQLGLDRLERVAARLERRSRQGGIAGATAEELLARIATRVDELGHARQLGSTGSVLPEGASATDDATLLAEREARRQAEDEARALRDQLRASELARVELETRHASELTQMADHVQRQLKRLEDDLKKKKRGLSELTQQNIELQNQLARLTGGTPGASPAEPPAPLPRSARDPERIPDDAP